MNATEAKTKLQYAAEALGLSIKSTFVPWSQSRNKGEKHKSLNWRVQLLKGDKVILETDYSAGEGHCPSYKQDWGRKRSVHQQAAIDSECERGVAVAWVNDEGTHFKFGKTILPDSTDVIHSLVMDADVIDYPTYEEWAPECGYDADSRKGEAIYRLCLQHALALRSAIGDAGLKELREAGQDY